jgi:hypothetical protein
MHEVTFPYQVLMNAVLAATDARGSIYPNDYNYMALPLSIVESIVADFNPRECPTEMKNSHDQARRLWYQFKESWPLCACGIVRLISPVPNDLVGIITAEDIHGAEVKLKHGQDLLNREMLSDDLSELSEVPIFFPSRRIQPGSEQPSSPINQSRKNQDNDSTPKVEMTLIEPQTKAIFKRSQGGTFGEGRWPVSQIKAFAVWF